MANFELFSGDKDGIFRGFSNGGLEFHADLVLPYQNRFQSIPMHGQFLLVQLETENEAVLGRISSLSSAGKLSSGSGEEYNIRAVKEGRDIPEDLREDYLKYQVDIRVLGVVRRREKRINGETSYELTFVASHRRLPHVGSPVAFLSDDVLQEIAFHNIIGAEIGFFALGEFIYAGNNETLEREDWMLTREPEVMVKFPIENLVSRRSFIFARAGFGKSNLNKLLFSKLYEGETPTVEKREKRRVPVGTLLFDPDGEYFWPDDRGNPGLCDVPGFEERLVVFTDRGAPSNFYSSFVAGGVRIDLRRFDASDIFSIALSPERQDQQNVRKLKSLNSNSWAQLVDLIAEHGNQADLATIQEILQLTGTQEMEALAARANVTSVVRMLHSSSSFTLDMVMQSLQEGKLCVFDISQMRGTQGLILSALILRRIFNHNQQQFTEAAPQTIPTIAVIEEAQSVLSERATGAGPYIEWVKEGRKYDLGAVMITQQPGSIPNEILSQGDNWFIFHLLSASDLNNVKSANAHFSHDILSSLLNEPIPGQGAFWSSALKRPYPISIRALSFSNMYERMDREYNREQIGSYARSIRQSFESNSEDTSVRFRQIAVEAVRSDTELMSSIRSENGAAWGKIKAMIMNSLPNNIDDPDKIAFDLVSNIMNEIFGPQGQAWESFKGNTGSTYVRELQ